MTILRNLWSKVSNLLIGLFVIGILAIAIADPWVILGKEWNTLKHRQETYNIVEDKTKITITAFKVFNTSSEYYFKDTDGVTGKLPGSTIFADSTISDFNKHDIGDTIEMDRRRFFSKDTNAEELRQYKLVTVKDWPEKELEDFVNK